MAFIDYVLERPSYGWTDKDGNLSKPSPGILFKEFFRRLNVFSNKKNWLSFTSWMMIVCLAVPFSLLLFKYMSLKTLLIAFAYSMIVMGSHGTVWYHRYCTHRAFKFRNPVWRFITQNITLKIIPEEIYVISHHVHHSKSDQPGDPYNAQGGFLYCFLADVNHQPISKSLDEKSYNRCVKLMQHTGQISNTYAQYQKWGSLANPFRTIGGIILNWGFWYAVFFMIGGHELACTIFGAAGFWAVGVRTFNYEGHGKGEDKRREGTDYNREDMSINQLWPGIVAGEWHNNHHLFPKSARSGFLPHQVDLAWCYIKLLSLIGGVTEYHDSKKKFLKEYYHPHKEAKTVVEEPVLVLEPIK